MGKILTIVIPTYNMQDYLRKCLDSLIVPKEQMKLLEVLVVNDGSKDNSSAIAHKYQDKYPNSFRVIDKENGNYGSCVNCGLKEAAGKYIKILDADDSFATENFSKYLMFLLETDADLIVNDFCSVNKNDTITGTRQYRLPKKTVVFNETIRKIFNKKNFQMHAAAYKLDTVRSIDYKQTEGISYTDQEWIYTPLMAVNTVAYFDRVVYQYLIGREGQTMSKEALKRGLSQNQQCVIRILKDYANMPRVENTAVTRYLKDQAIASMNYIYTQYLLVHRDLDLNGLNEFEKNIKAIDSSLIDLADEITMLGTYYTFVKNWHLSRKRSHSVWFFYNLFCSKLFGYLNRMSEL